MRVLVTGRVNIPYLRMSAYCEVRKRKAQRRCWAFKRFSCCC